MSAGFWVGFADSLKRGQEQKREERLIFEQRAARQNEIRDERAWREAQAEKDRKFSLEQMRAKTDAERKLALQKALLERQQGSQMTPEQMKAQFWVTKNVEGYEGADDIIASTTADPTLATQLQSSYQDYVEKAQKTGIEPMPVTEFLNFVDIYGIESASDEDAIIDYDAMMKEVWESDLSDDETYIDMYGNVMGGKKRGGVYTMDVDPKLGTDPDFERYARQEKAFTAEVSKLGGKKYREIVEEYGKESPEAIEFNSILQEFDANDLSKYETEVLIDQVGEEAFGNISDSKLFSNAKDNPYFRTRYFDDTEEAIPTDVTTMNKVEFSDTGEEVEEVIPERVTDLPPEVVANLAEENVTFQEWKGMSRKEREKRGLPVSEIGGQWRYKNREGGWSLTGTPDPKIEIDLSKYPDADPADVVDQLKELGELQTGDYITINGRGAYVD